MDETVIQSALEAARDPIVRTTGPVAELWRHSLVLEKRADELRTIEKQASAAGSYATAREIQDQVLEIQKARESLTPDVNRRLPREWPGLDELLGPAASDADVKKFKDVADIAHEMSADAAAEQYDNLSKTISHQRRRVELLHSGLAPRSVVDEHTEVEQKRLSSLSEALVVTRTARDHTAKREQTVRMREEALKRDREALKNRTIMRRDDLTGSLLPVIA